MIAVAVLIAVVSLLAWVFVLRPLCDMTRSTLAYVKEMVELFEGIPGSLASLTTDMSAQTRSQGVALHDVLTKLELAADRSMTAARILAENLEAREEKVDTASTGVADDLAASVQRATDMMASGAEPGAAADASFATVKGERGEIGETGEQGEIGETGETGPEGKRGPIGPVGPVGPQGEQGEPGEDAG